jgi:hypothetical protein
MARSLFFFLLNFLNDLDDIRTVLVIKGNFIFNIGLLYFTNVFKSFTQKVKLKRDVIKIIRLADDSDDGYALFIKNVKKIHVFSFLHIHGKFQSNRC